MTRHAPRSISTPATLRTLADPRAALALGLTALALLGAATAAGTAAAQADQPTVRVGSPTVAPDGTVTVGVVLTAAPDGLSGYYLDVSVSNPDVARIESASYPDAFGLTTDPSVGSDGAAVTLEAADVEGAVEPGASNVTLATVELAGVAPGEADLTVDPRQFDADGGAAFTPATRAGAVTVSDDGAATAADSGTGTAAADAAEATATRTGGAATGTPDATQTAAPLSPVTALVAVGATAAVALLRRP